MRNIKRFFTDAGVGVTDVDMEMALTWLAKELDLFEDRRIVGPWEARYKSGNGELLDLRRYR